jgi:hypothetical protein
VAADHGNAERGRSWKGGAAVGCELGAQELTRKSEKRNVETPAVLVRAKDRSPGLACGFSTATARWRPTGVRGNHGARGERQRGGATTAGRARVTRGEEGKQGLNGGDKGRAAARREEALHRRQNRGAEMQKGRRGRRREGKGPED